MYYMSSARNKNSRYVNANIKVSVTGHVSMSEFFTQNFICLYHY